MIYNSIKKIISLLMIASIVVSQSERIVISVADISTTNISSIEEVNIRDRIEAEISNIKSLQLVSYLERQEVINEIEFQQSCVSQECAAKVGAMLGAAYMIMPSIRKDNNSGMFAATFKLIHVETGAIVQGGVEIRDQNLRSINDLKAIIGDIIINIGRKISGDEGDLIFFMDEGQKLYQVQFDINAENAYVSHGTFSAVQTIGNTTIFKLPSGEYAFRFEKNQYQTVTKLIRVSEDAQYSIQMVRDDSEIIPYIAPGMISINTKPQGAEIIINNQRIGTTPYTGTLISGDHVIDLRLAMYHPSSFKFTLEENESEEINETLKPRFGFVTINTVPSQANVTIDNKPLGTSPINQYQLLDGKHEINISKNLYHSTSRVIEVKEGKSDQLTMQLDKAYGMLQVVTLNTSDADVYLDGIKKGKTPFENLMIASGTYLLEVKKEYFNSISEEVDITDEKLTTRTLPMTTNVGVVKIDAGIGTLFINDENKGGGKFELKLKPGSYAFKSEAPNHYPNAKEIMVRAGDNTDLDLKPIPRLGSIAVFVTPEEAKNAEIYIDGELKGKAPKVITLTMGNHDVEIKLKDYITANKGAKVKEGQTTEIKFEMLDYKGSIQQRLTFSKNMGFATLGVAAASAFLRQGAVDQSNEYFQLYNNANTQSNAVKYKELAQDAHQKENLYTALAVVATSATAFYFSKLLIAYVENTAIAEKEAIKEAKSQLLKKADKSVVIKYLETYDNYVPAFNPAIEISLGYLKPREKYVLLADNMRDWIIIYNDIIATVRKRGQGNYKVYPSNKSIKPQVILIARRNIKVHELPTSAIKKTFTTLNKGTAVYLLSSPRKGWYTIMIGQGAVGYVRTADMKKIE